MKHQFKFALGNLKKTFFTSLLNVIGLTTAFSAFLLISLYVWNEYRYDGFNEHASEIYRLEIKSPLNPKTSVFMFGQTGQTLVDEFPEILASTIYMPWGRWTEGTFTWNKNNEEVKSFEDYAYSDEYLTDIFTFNVINGNAVSPLKEPLSAMVSESFALKAWGTSDVIGKGMVSGTQNYTVTAVFADMEPNSVIESPIILKLPETGRLAEAAKSWDVVNYPTFIKVKPGTDPDYLNTVINTQSIVRDKLYFFNKGNIKAEVVARPLRDLHFTEETSETPIFSGNSQKFVNSLFWVGILILLVALVNYINFSTANIPKRIKSVSITRVLGGTRSETLLVLVIETLLVFGISFILALLMTWIINQGFTESILGYKLPAQPLLITIVGGGILLFAVIAGLYPGFTSTRRKPVETIKKYDSRNHVAFRGILTIFQFTATIALIALSTLIIKQIHFVETANLGFNKNNTVVIQLNQELKKNLNSFKTNLITNPYIKSVAFSRAVPGQAQEMTTFQVNDQQCQTWYWAADDQYIEMMNFELIRGRNFLNNSQAEVGNMICNETAARSYGWDIGTKVGNGIIVGILKDFNFVSLREKVEPFTFWYSTDNNHLNYASIKLQGDNIAEALNNIEKSYNTFCSQTPFRYFFLDEHMNLLYSKENQQVKLITFFAFLSIIVSVLGILGLSIFMCQQKVKEIGIRKVNGARISEILTMLNRDFIKWVFIALILAIPAAWFSMHYWLKSFTYKTEVSWWIYALAGLLALVIALFTVSLQSWKAATRNPVEALRYE